MLGLVTKRGLEVREVAGADQLDLQAALDKRRGVRHLLPEAGAPRRPRPRTCAVHACTQYTVQLYCAALLDLEQYPSSERAEWRIVGGLTGRVVGCHTLFSAGTPQAPRLWGVSAEGSVVGRSRLRIRGVRCGRTAARGDGRCAASL